MQRELTQVKWVDVVCDTYKPDSLKSYTRECHGEGEALRISDKTKVPSNWKSFLRVDTNKCALFQYLAKKSVAVIDVHADKVFLSTFDNDDLSSCGLDLTDLRECNHEEADYRIMLHAKHGKNHGYNRIMIHATDTDVIVLSVAVVSVLQCELWVAFGHGKDFRHIPAHAI